MRCRPILPCGKTDATVLSGGSPLRSPVTSVRKLSIGGAVWAMAGSGGRSKGRFSAQLAQAQLELLLVRQTLGWLPSRTKPAQQVVRKAYPTLLFLFCSVKPATIRPPVHPWRLAREGVDDARPGTQPHADLPDPPNTSIARVLTLRCIGQATALAAGEEMTVAGVQLCNTAATARPSPVSSVHRNHGRAPRSTRWARTGGLGSTRRSPDGATEM